MNQKYVESFSDAFLTVMPQVGITDVQLQNEEECGNIIRSPGVVVIFEMSGNLKGNVFFAMHENCAKMLASTLMCGMEVEELDEMAQSAVSELGNMLAANACTNLSDCDAGIVADISTPKFIHGDFTANASSEHTARLELKANEHPFYIYVSVEKVSCQ